MADFVLNAPGTVNEPFTPAGVIVPVSTIQSDAQGIRAGVEGVDATFAHNATYGSTITATATIATTNPGDDIVIGAAVRTGTNAGAVIGIEVQATQVAAGTIPATGIFVPVSASVPITRAIGDVFSSTVTISGGVATISGSQNATPFAFNFDTTTTFAAEPSLAAGGQFFPQDLNGTRISQFTGTGVVGTGAALDGAATDSSSATGTLNAAAPLQPILLDQAGKDQISAGTTAGDGTGTPGRFIVLFLKQWAADLNTMLAQLFGATTYLQPATGFAVTIGPGVSDLILDPAGTLAAGAVTMPVGPGDRQKITVATSHTITALTVSANPGQTIAGAPTTLVANTSFQYRYKASNSTWYRLY
jgi:hypothetical protein